MVDNILDLFEGLSKQQAQQLRERILPTISELRREIMAKEVKKQADKTRQELVDEFTAIEARVSHGL